MVALKTDTLAETATTFGGKSSFHKNIDKVVAGDVTLVGAIVTRAGNLLEFGHLFKAFGNN